MSLVPSSLKLIMRKNFQFQLRVQCTSLIHKSWPISDTSCLITSITIAKSAVLFSFWIVPYQLCRIKHAVIRRHSQYSMSIINVWRNGNFMLKSHELDSIIINSTTKAIYYFSQPRTAILTRANQITSMTVHIDHISLPYSFFPEHHKRMYSITKYGQHLLSTQRTNQIHCYALFSLVVSGGKIMRNVSFSFFMPFSCSKINP